MKHIVLALDGIADEPNELVLDLLPTR